MTVPMQNNMAVRMQNIMQKTTHLDGKGPAWDGENRTVEEVRAELFCV